MNADKPNYWISRLDYLFVLRPILFFPGWSTMLAGYYIDTNVRWFPFNVPIQNLTNIVLLILGFAMVMGSSFILNQLQDVESDKKNRKLFFISDGILSVATAKREIAILFVLSLIIGFYIKLQVGILFIIFFIVTGYLYNFAPALMKNRPWGSLLSNALMGWLAFAIGWGAVHDLNVRLVSDSLPYLIFNITLYLFTTLPDTEGDRQSGKRTLAVLFGMKNVIRWAVSLYIIGLFISLYMQDYQALIFYLLSIPFFGIIPFRMTTSDTIRATKFGIFFFAISVCIRFPYYFILMLIGFFGTQLYFKKRFDFNYPNFSGK